LFQGSPSSSGRRAPTAPPIAQILADPTDNLLIQREIEKLANPQTGRIVIRLTPGNHGGAVLCQDLVQSLGLAPRPDWTTLSSPITAATVTAFRTAGGRDAYVLRAHQLNSLGWWRLASVGSRVPLRLWMVTASAKVSAEKIRSLRIGGLRVAPAPRRLTLTSEGVTPCLLATEARVWKCRFYALPPAPISCWDECPLGRR
jgi:hypothetical protein